MAMQINDEIRNEAQKISEYVIEDTKRTVEMLKWMKNSQQTKPPFDMVTTALAVGSTLATGNMLEGANILGGIILPRLRERLQETPVIEDLPDSNIAIINGLQTINDRVFLLRNLLTNKELNAHDLDDICYDVQIMISGMLKEL